MRRALAAAVDPVAELRDLVEELRDRVATLEARYGPRDQAEAAVPPAVARSVGGRRFTSAELFAHAAVDPDLAAALEAADVTSPRELGRLLARLEVQPSALVAIVRVAESRGCVIWAVRVNNPQTRTAG